MSFPIANALPVVIYNGASPSLDDDLRAEDDALPPAAPERPRRAAFVNADLKRAALEDERDQQEADDIEASNASILANRKANLVRLKAARQKLQPTLRIVSKGFDTISVLPNDTVLKLDESIRGAAKLLMKVSKKHHKLISKSAVVAF